MARRKAPWILLAVPLLAAAGAWIWVKSLEAAGWHRLERRVEELRAEQDARCGPRPVLRGEPLPGNAWDDYLPAIDLAANLSLDRVYPESAHDADADQIGALMATAAPAIEGMRRGTRRAESRRVRLHEKVTTSGDMFAAYDLASLAGARVRCLAMEGKSREAAELAADLWRFAMDAAGDGSEVAERLGGVIAIRAYVTVEYLLTHRRLAPEDLRRLDAELAALDAAFPGHGPALQGRLEYYGTWILNGARLDDLRGVGCVVGGARVEAGWRQAWSVPLFLVAAFDRTDAYLTRIRDAERSPVAEELAARAKAAADLGDRHNWLFNTFARRMPDSAQIREMRARLRLLCAAAHHAATGEFLELDDPMGNKITHQEWNDDVLLFRSEGLRPDDDGTTVNYGHIQLEMPRKACPSCLPTEK